MSSAPVSTSFPGLLLTGPLQVFSEWKIYCRLVNFLWLHFSGPLMACCVLYQPGGDQPLTFSKAVPWGRLTHTHRVSAVLSDKSLRTRPQWFTACHELSFSGTNGPTRQVKFVVLNTPHTTKWSVKRMYSVLFWAPFWMTSLSFHSNSRLQNICLDLFFFALFISNYL